MVNVGDTAVISNNDNLWYNRRGKVVEVKESCVTMCINKITIQFNVSDVKKIELKKKKKKKSN